MAAFYVNCYMCKQTVKRYQETKTNRYFCSIDCKSEFQKTDEHLKEHWTEDRRKSLSLKNKGENNPNFGNRWDDELKQRVSEIAKERYEDEEYYNRFCEANRNRTWTEEGKNNIGMAALKTIQKKKDLGIPMIEMTQQTRKNIGIKSKEKFKDPAYNKRIRKIMEERGYWVPIHLKNDYDVYFKLADWDDYALINLSESDRELFYSDTRKFVRDHMYGRYDGFLNLVFPEILRHPSNCQILTRSENVKKRQKDKDRCIELDELFSLIREYDKFYDKQEECLELIRKYENGQRWRREK